MALPSVPSTRPPPWLIVFNPMICNTAYKNIKNDAARETFHHRFQSTALKTDEITTKNIPRWRRVMYPSMRSKLDQKLLMGATPKRLAKPMMTKKPATAYKMTDFFGR